MSVFLDDGDVRLYHGNALDVLRELSDESVDCVVTSPPYWGLRDYGTEGQLGLEPTPDLFVTNMVEVFREIRRVLAPHGTCWVNLGDSYAGGGYSNHDGTGGAQREDGGKQAHTRSTALGLKPKDLVGIPWRVAFALQQDGWWLRSDIIWAKPNPMPESVTDRPTKAHEYVFLLTKQPRYWFDAEAVREPHESTRWGGKYSGPSDGWKNGSRIRERDDRDHYPNGGRNVRSVWNIATQPYPEAHFATFPEELARRCILAGCPTRVCRVCGKPSERIIENRLMLAADGKTCERCGKNHGKPREGSEHRAAQGVERFACVDHATVGWSDCGCLEEHAGSGCRATPTQSGELAEGNDAGTDSACSSKWRPGVVLDPFIGSGTTAKVARDHQRHAIGIDLSLEYLELAARRLQQLSLLT